MRDDDYSTTEAEAARAANVIGRNEWVGSDVGSQEFVTTPYCNRCQRGTKDYTCGPCKRDAADLLVSLDCPVCGDVMHGGRCDE